MQKISGLYLFSIEVRRGLFESFPTNAGCNFMGWPNDATDVKRKCSTFVMWKKPVQKALYEYHMSQPNCEKTMSIELGYI